MKQFKGVVSALMSLALIGTVVDLIADKAATASAQEKSDRALDQVRSQLSDLEKFPLFLPSSQGTITAADDRLSPTQIGSPSFSWIRDQVSDRLGSATLIEQWQAYTTPEGFQYVDVVVNESQWNQLRYFSQYGFILQFGTVAQANRYQLRVFHSGDATNRSDALALQDARDNLSASERERARRTITNRSVVLRGSYFCESTSSLSPADTLDVSENVANCSVFVSL
ncbi:MAG: hypothetical protein AAFZ17_23210 [Cyanobacteria bacterium J06650_10]